ncbi:uncharacterized protein DUF2357 [Ureibacillus xyleni]|uniref:Uncharacterized protein DUF2357 n=1 Tax=Ureibacillus xyleni TaxID=614648 RepID=A0A285RZ30_9BACL|nr:DUF2357 domain-containing protein [Ureibacillus xyleni]SOB99495.1 uncharacterized protein DUF2357 [Ureibacillus xyleni]
MVIHTNQLGFTVEFIQKYKDGEQESIRVKHFVRDFKEWDEQLYPYTIIRENLNLELKFGCENTRATLSMDGLDILKDRKVEYDEFNNAYIHPGALTLFEHGSEINYYPYIPGIYCLTVTIEGENYYSFIKVISNRLSDEQLNTMRNEVENQLKGLAYDVVRKQNIAQELNIDLTLFQHFKVLDFYYDDLTMIFMDLSNKVRFTLKRDYALQSIEKPSHVDAVSIQYQLKHPESTTYLKTRKNLVNYDLPENRLLKRIVKKWSLITLDFLQQVEYNINQYQKGEDLFSSYVSRNRRKSLLTQLENYRQTAFRLKAMLDRFQLNYWFKEVSDITSSSIPDKMHMDVRYNKLLKIHRYITTSERDVALHPAWKSHWKRTDQLYEIWCFFKVIDYFKSKNYQFTNAPKWFFGEMDETIDNLFVIPTIPAGANFELEKGNMQFKVFYDETVPKTQQETENAKPIYTTGDNNKPDIRIDLFIQGVYIGSIILDSKYRKRDVLMDSKNQLISYADHIRSPFIYNKKRWERIRPVHRVIVLYPDKYNTYGIDYLNDKSINLVPLTPQSTKAHFEQMLEDLINEMILDAEEAGVILNRN